jgi:hypothetical protein
MYIAANRLSRRLRTTSNNIDEAREVDINN